MSDYNDNGCGGGGESTTSSSSSSSDNFFDEQPTKMEKIEMRKASKTPSGWLRWLCKDWAEENDVLLQVVDEKFIRYKPYLKGMLSSQLLCRLSMPNGKDGFEGTLHQGGVDLWGTLGIEDEFDKTYIVSQVERFCIIYNIRGNQVEAEDHVFSTDIVNADSTALAAAAAAGMASSQSGVSAAYLDQNAAAAAAAAVSSTIELGRLSFKQVSEVSKAHRMAREAERALEIERRQNMKREQKRQVSEKRESKHREKEIQAIRKAAEKAARDATREERRKRKVEIRAQREKFAQQQKEAALNRAKELVESNRVPIEITRGATAAKIAAANAIIQHAVTPVPEEDLNTPNKKQRSAIVVSNASDLNRIVTHSKNLWAKYNAIAKEHNQKVNWTTVSKDLGIHVKVREKYARMHSRAEARGFDWVKYGHWKIKDHPEIFVEPTLAEQRAKMPPPPPPLDDHAVLGDDNKDVSDEAVAAAAAAVVDASVNAPPVDTVVQTTDEHSAAAAAVAASYVPDPTVSMQPRWLAEHV